MQTDKETQTADKGTEAADKEADKETYRNSIQRHTETDKETSDRDRNSKH